MTESFQSNLGLKVIKFNSKILRFQATLKCCQKKITTDASGFSGQHFCGAELVEFTLIGFRKLNRLAGLRQDLR